MNTEIEKMLGIQKVNSIPEAMEQMEDTIIEIWKLVDILHSQKVITNKINRKLESLLLQRLLNGGGFKYLRRMEDRENSMDK